MNTIRLLRMQQLLLSLKSDRIQYGTPDFC